MSRRIDSEETLIARYLAPLAAGCPGALGLTDDCATLVPPAGEELVLTTDAVAEGVHFLPDDTPEDIAWKALAVNVSDLAGKGAQPIAYLMSLSFPEAPEEGWLEKFVTGLGRAQRAFGLTLAGGDTDRRPGPLAITITAIGSVPEGTMVRRSTARPGDRILVSGTLGDAALGLELRRHPELAVMWGLDGGEREHLLRRYCRPEPRLSLRAALRSAASAAMDVSDGLAKDLARLCRASGCGAVVEAGLAPLSSAARRAVAAEPNRIGLVLTGGDDYEVLAAVAPEKLEAFRAAAAAAGTSVHDIGTFAAGGDVQVIGADGRGLLLDHAGWDHFAP